MQIALINIRSEQTRLRKGLTRQGQRQNISDREKIDAPLSFFIFKHVKQS